MSQFIKCMNFALICYSYRVFNKYGTSKVATGVIQDNEHKFKIISNNTVINDR